MLNKDILINKKVSSTYEDTFYINYNWKLVLSNKLLVKQESTSTNGDTFYINYNYKKLHRPIRVRLMKVVHPKQSAHGRPWLWS